MRGMRRARRSSRGLPSHSTPGGSSAWSGETGRASQPCSSAWRGSRKKSSGRFGSKARWSLPREGPSMCFWSCRTPTTNSFARACATSWYPRPRLLPTSTSFISKRSWRSLAWGDVADRHPASLSGGQKQRCVCAIASESGAQALLLDEPTSGLDFRNMERLALILREEASRGKTVAVVSHDTEFLSKACDQIVLIE